jgi:hypothetical protein
MHIDYFASKDEQHVSFALEQSEEEQQQVTSIELSVHSQSLL